MEEKLRSRISEVVIFNSGMTKKVTLMNEQADILGKISNMISKINI